MVPEIDEVFYINQQDMGLFNIAPDYDNCIRFLAPLDNLLWDRMLIQKIFYFQYSWEVYIPIEKRKYGYYVLTVLYQNKIIARMEPIKQEAGMPFGIKKWWWEPNKRLRNAVENELKVFSKYLNADGVDKETSQIIFNQ
jgi:uncharacterized protein YcaQ